MNIIILLGYFAVALVLFFGLLRTGGFRFLSGSTKSALSAVERSWLLKYRPLILASLIGLGWTLLHTCSVAVIIWIAKKLRSWCKKTVFSFSGEAVKNYVAFTIGILNALVTTKTTKYETVYSFEQTMPRDVANPSWTKCWICSSSTIVSAPSSSSPIKLMDLPRKSSCVDASRTVNTLLHCPDRLFSR